MTRPPDSHENYPRVRDIIPAVIVVEFACLALILIAIMVQMHRVTVSTPVVPDSGFHKALDLNGTEYCVPLSYAQSSAGQRDDENRFAHLYPYGGSDC